MPATFHRLGGFSGGASLDEPPLPASSLTRNTRNDTFVLACGRGMARRSVRPRVRKETPRNRKANVAWSTTQSSAAWAPPSSARIATRNTGTKVADTTAVLLAATEENDEEQAALCV